MPNTERNYRGRSERPRPQEQEPPRKMSFLQKNLWQAAACIAILAAIVIVKSMAPGFAAQLTPAVKSAISYTVDVSWVQSYVTEKLFPAGVAPTDSPAPTDTPTASPSDTPDASTTPDDSSAPDASTAPADSSSPTDAPADSGQSYL